MKRYRRTQIVFAMTGARGLCGGIATTNLNILHALKDLATERRMKLSVISLLENASDRPDFLPRQVRFDAMKGNKMRFSLKLLQALAWKPIFCFDHVTLARPILLAAKLNLVQTVIFAHGSEAWKRIRKASRQSFRKADLCLTNSEFTLKKMKQVMGRFKAESCPLGLSPGFELNPTLPVKRDGQLTLQAADGIARSIGDQMFLHVARIDPDERQKGHTELLNVLPLLRNGFEDLQVVFAGPGEDIDRLRQTAMRLSIGGSVFFPGWVPAEVLRELYRRCYAFVMPSTQEGFGLTFLEAMNEAKACVGCWDQGAEDVIVDGETGFLLKDQSDERELYSVLHALLNNPGLCSKMGARGFERLHQSFTARHFQERFKAKVSTVL